MDIYAGYGNLNSITGEGSFGTERGKTKFSAYGGYADSDGEDFTIRADGAGQSGTTSDPQRDGYGGFKISHGERLEVNANFGYRRQAEFIGLGNLISPDQVDPCAWFTAGLVYRHPISERLLWNTTLAGGLNRWGTSLILNGLPNPAFPKGVYNHVLTQEYHGDLDSHLQFSQGSQSIIGGLSSRIAKNPTDESLTTNGPEEPANASPPPFTKIQQREVFSGYLQYRWEMIKGLKFTGGVRYDNYSDFGNTVNPRAGLVYAPTDKYFACATYGRAFRAPSYKEL